jgi:excisionase family DNA binding protein
VSVTLIYVNDMTTEQGRNMRKNSAVGRQPVLVTLQQAADYSGVPYTSIRKLVLEGHLPRVQLGDSKRTWVKRADLERLIEASTETTAR